EAAMQLPPAPPSSRPLWKNVLYFVCMILFLVFSDWAAPGDVILTLKDGARVEAISLQETKDTLVYQLKHDFRDRKEREEITFAKEEIVSVAHPDSWVVRVLKVKWYIAGTMGLLVLLMLWRWFKKEEVVEWFKNTWDFTKTLVPLLFGGVFITGFVGILLPQKYVATFVGDNSLQSNLVASVVGAFWYFATLTEIPVTQALMKLGMHRGPVLALLLAGPALSLPSMLVIAKVMGWKKTLVFCFFVVVIATFVGMLFGALV
ncbi:MAG: permease, partial [Planctomycetota bacterium]|nr:permease [Planctomycetota bacterium]